MSERKAVGTNPYADEKGRLYFYDNAKFILIFLVVLAHIISPFKTDNYILHTLWRFINTLHMPTLIFISGFFAKKYIRPDGGLKVQRTFSYIMLFLFSQLFISLFEYFVLKDRVGFSLLSARSSLWFLQCLSIWYLVLPFFDKFKPLCVFITAVFLGLLIGYDPSAENILAISRVIVHFPFFLAGYYCSQCDVEKLFNFKFRIFAVIFTLVCVLVFVFLFKDVPDHLLTCNAPYKNLGLIKEWPVYLRWLSRAGFYVMAFGLGAAFLSFVPRKKCFFTTFGSRTLQVYILHRFPYMAWIDNDLGWWMFFNNMKGGLAIVFAMAVAVTFILSLKPFSYPFNLIQKIPVKPFLKNTDNRENK